MTEKASDNNFKLLLIGTIGIVYGDIGTSPLYALQSCFSLGNIAVTPTNILGLLSLVIWVLFLIVTVKYVFLVLKADNEGEGGILSLASLCSKLSSPKYSIIPLLLGVIGISFLFADGIITPAISVLGALEGVELIFPISSNYIIYVAIALLTALFLVQKKGTHKLGKFFGPIMIVWFITLSILGIAHIIDNVSILKAINPFYAVNFLIENKLAGLKTMGGIILVVTGAEALYSDLGHFGKKPIQFSWLFFVFPALTLNYLGQGSVLMLHPEFIDNPFYHLAPDIIMYPLILLSTLATIIASQSIITGMFSVSCQAIMLGYLPKMRIYHTSAEQIGQVYVPVVNYVIYFFTICFTLYFKTATDMSSIYGLSVAIVMLITTVLVIYIARLKWKWSLLALILVFGPIVFIDVLFVTTNLLKLFDGAVYMLIIGIIVSYAIWLWISGSKAMYEQRLSADTLSEDYIDKYIAKNPIRIPGSAIFLSKNPNHIPHSLLVYLKHNKFLHEKVFFVSIITEDVPRVDYLNKYLVEPISDDSNVYSVIVRYGFREVPDFYRIINWMEEKGLINNIKDLTIFLSKSVPQSSEDNKALNNFNGLIYTALHTALSSYDFYKLPNDNVIELGVRYKI